MFSPQSKIVSIHQIILNPFTLKKDGNMPSIEL